LRRNPRVGGRLDYHLLGTAYNYIGEGWIKPEFNIDLKDAIAAELVVEKMLCHGGTENTFSFEVDTAGHWWPQNLVYGMILRIYYEPSVIEIPGKITSPIDGENLAQVIEIIVETANPALVTQIDLIGYYKDVDMEGDGIYQQCHYEFHKGEIFNHIGTLSKTPYQFR
jgi:hypothetical protein